MQETVVNAFRECMEIAQRAHQGQDALGNDQEGSMFFDLFHTHYWGPPRRREDGIHYMTCCECGKQRKLKVNIGDQPVKRLETKVRPEKAVRAA